MMIREGTARQLGLWGQDVFNLTREGVLTPVRECKPKTYLLKLPTPRTSGEWLRMYRMQAGLRKTELARRAGIDVNTVHRAEEDERDMWLVSLYCILRTLGVRLAEHVSRIEGEEQPAPLRVTASLGLEDAIAYARIAFGVKIATSAKTPRIGTILAACKEQDVDVIEFFCHVDSLLGEMP